MVAIAEVAEGRLGGLDCVAAGSSCLSGPLSSGISATDTDVIRLIEPLWAWLAVPDCRLLFHRKTDSFRDDAELVTDTLFPSVNGLCASHSEPPSVSATEGALDTRPSLLFGPTSTTGVQVRSALNIDSGA